MALMLRAWAGSLASSHTSTAAAAAAAATGAHIHTSPDHPMIHDHPWLTLLTLLLKSHSAASGCHQDLATSGGRSHCSSSWAGVITAACPALAADPCCNQLQRQAQCLHVRAGKVRSICTACPLHLPSSKVPASSFCSVSPFVIAALIYSKHCTKSPLSSPQHVAHSQGTSSAIPPHLPLPPHATHRALAVMRQPHAMPAPHSSCTRPYQGHTHSSCKTPCQQNPGITVSGSRLAGLRLSTISPMQTRQPAEHACNHTSSEQPLPLQCRPKPEPPPSTQLQHSLALIH
jgi:hypothetical protein